MQWPLQSRSIIRALSATLAALATTSVLAWFDFTAVTAGLIFLVIVVWCATRAGIRLSLYIAVLCALLFDYFFLPPYHTFDLAGGAEWVAMVSFVASSIVAGRVSERARNQARHAEERREEVERLYTLSQNMLLRDDAATLTRDLPEILERVFALERVVLYMRDQDKLYAAAGELPDALLTVLRQQAGSDTSASLTSERFEVHALVVGTRSVGALAWRPASFSRELATAVCAQTAIALTRAIAIEANTRLEATRQSERLRVALIDSLTHELRTPLTSIRAAATTLMDGNGLDDASRYDLATIVDEEASRLDHLIGEAVEMAEIDTKGVTIQEQPHSPRAVLQDAVDQSRTVLARHVVEIEAAESDSPALFDARLLSRVFRHLLENAARYSPPGSRIVLGNRRTQDRLEFSVADNGPGIDPVDLPLIFEKFYRGRKAAKFGKGSGMGLAIARSLLKAHGGGIEAASTPGHGTSFNFWIPLKEIAAPQNAAPPSDSIADSITHDMRT
jgi:two-component system, OmpR family, sensor histidine kinase KdpD